MANKKLTVQVEGLPWAVDMIRTLGSVEAIVRAWRMSDHGLSVAQRQEAAEDAMDGLVDLLGISDEPQGCPDSSLVAWGSHLVAEEDQ